MPKKFKVRILEVISAGGSWSEITVEVEADDETSAIEKAQPPYPSKYGRIFSVTPLS